MLLYFIYYASYFFILSILLYLGLHTRRHPAEVVFLVGVSLIPIGKLFYMPYTGLVSVTAGFIFTTIVGSISLLISFIKGVEKFAFVPFMIMVPVLLSILFLFAPSQSLFISASSNAASAGSPLLRVISVLFTCIYCSYVTLYVARHEQGHNDVARYYVLATLFATFVGIFIAYGLFFGLLDRNNVMPISVEDVHMAGRIYRFNPGASVNEFGEIIGYAIFMLRWTGWQNRWKMFAAGVLLLAEFFSLTRGAWLGLVVGYFVYGFFSTKQRRSGIFWGAALLVAVLLVIVLSSGDLTYLLVSRTSFAESPGGDDRINTATAVFDAMAGSPLRLFFGYGWSADIFSPNYGFDKIGYIHSVPLMFLFDTGLVGVTFCAIAFIVFGKFVRDNVRHDFDIIAGIVAFMFTLSMVEHIFYHVQTWLIFGVILGLAFRSARTTKLAYLEGSVQPQLLQ